MRGHNGQVGPTRCERVRIASLALVALCIGIAGCSDGGGGADGDGDASGTSSSSTSPTGGSGPGPAPMAAITVAAVGTYPVNPAFDPTTLSVPAGANVTVTFLNQDTNTLVQHNWVVEGIAGAASANIGGGASDEFAFTAPLQPGEHAYYCSIGDHRARGMEGTLTVTGP